MVFCVEKVFRNFRTKEKSLNREKDLWFVTDFSPDFSNRERLMRVLTSQPMQGCFMLTLTALINILCSTVDVILKQL